MPRPAETMLQASASRLQPLRLGAALALVLAVLPLPAQGQDGQAPGVQGPEELNEPDLRERVFGPTPEPTPAPSPAPPETPGGERQIAFEATSLDYDSDADVVTASGDVLLRSGDQSVRADAVSWNRTTGQIVATGDIRMVDE